MVPTASMPAIVHQLITAVPSMDCVLAVSVPRDGPAVDVRTVSVLRFFFFFFVFIRI